MTAMLVVAVLTAAGGCGGADPTRDQLVKALDDAASAVQTAALALDLRRDHRVTAAVASTACENQATELAGVQQTLASLAADDPAGDADRSRTSDLVQAGADRLATARMLLGTDGDLAGAAADLHATGGRLLDLAGQIEGRR